MSFHNVFDNGEPKAGSPLIPGARLIHPEKTLRHPLKIFFIDPYTAILHIELQPGRIPLRILNSDLYITPWLVILHAVFDQVRQNLLHLISLCENSDIFMTIFNRNRSICFLRLVLKALYHSHGGTSQTTSLSVWLQFPRFETGDPHQIVRQIDEPV